MPVAAGFLVAEFIVTAAAGLVVAVFRVLLLFAVFRVAMTVALLLFAVFRVPVAVTYSTSHRLVQIAVNTHHSRTSDTYRKPSRFQLSACSVS